MVTAAGKKRASPGAEEQKSLFDVEVNDEVNKKLQSMSNDILRVEIANGQSLPHTYLLCHHGPWQLRLV